jgi:type II secretory pathway pseudopilin PulG
MARSGHGSVARGYTLVEMLVATTLTLIMMGAVATVFGMIGQGVSGARASLEMADALRATAQRLRADLDGATQTVGPPHFGEWSDGQPGANEGYFEYIEGPLGPLVEPRWVARNTDRPWTPTAADPFQIPFEPDSTVADMDDILMFTTRSRGEPFVARYGGSPYESQDAEIAWFVRGRTLYRRVLMIRPDLSVSGPAGFYANNDISVRNVGGTLYANSLGDLTMPENRFAHQNALTSPNSPYPYHPHRYISGVVFGWSDAGNPANALARLNLPLLQECSDATWVAGGSLPTVALNADVETLSNPTQVGQGTASTPFDAWLNPHPWELPRPTKNAPHQPAVDKETGVVLNAAGYPMGTRFGEDVILSNVIGFDVKAWDPGAPVMVIRATRAGTVTVSAMCPGDPPRPAETNNPNAPNFTGYAKAVSRAGTTVTDNGATPPITYQYYDDLNGNGAFDAGEPTVLGYGAYVDLGYGGTSLFGGANYDATGANPGPRSNLNRVYDTWSLHYESDGIKEVGNTSGLTTDAGSNGFDDDGNGVVDDWNEMETQAPYPVPLRGIQIRICVFEPDSRQIREVTIVRDFLPK